MNIKQVLEDFPTGHLNTEPEVNRVNDHEPGSTHRVTARLPPRMASRRVDTRVGSAKSTWDEEDDS